MKESVQSSQAVFHILPRQVWQTFTKKQQQRVLETLVGICQTLLNQSSQERKHEPEPDC